MKSFKIREGIVHIDGVLYGQMRDISMFRFVNRELMQRIISQQVVFYKYNVTKTQVNMYGESSTGRYFT